ncbi:MAG: GAF domain-containing protein [Rhizobacter sp.]
MIHRHELLDPNALSVHISELLVATAEASDPGIDEAVTTVLRLLREQLRMDVVFVSEFADGRRVFRFVDRTADAPAVTVGASDPLEASYCQRVVDGRLAELVHDASTVPGLPATDVKVGAHLSTPIRLPDGSIYGTLCCFSTAPNRHLRDRDLVNLRHCAQLVGRKVNVAQERGQQPDWS